MLFCLIQPYKRIKNKKITFIYRYILVYLMLTITRKLKQLCKEPIWKKPLNIDLALKLIYSNLESNLDSKFTLDEWKSLISKFGLDSILTKLQKKYSFQLDPIPHSFSSRTYTYHFTNDKRILVSSKMSGQNYVTYDKIISMKGVHTAFEMKLGRGTNTYNKPSSFNVLFSQEGCQKIIHPLQEISRKRKVGLVIILAQDIYQENIENPIQEHNSTTMQKFQENGGIIMPFYTTRQKFENDVKESLTYYSIKVKDQANTFL